MVFRKILASCRHVRFTIDHFEGLLLCGQRGRCISFRQCHLHGGDEALPGVGSEKISEVG